jgi:hypothetical protein
MRNEHSLSDGRFKDVAVGRQRNEFFVIHGIL